MSGGQQPLCGCSCRIRPSCGASRPRRSFVAAAESAVARAGHAVTDMAYFAARDEAPAAKCASPPSRPLEIFVLVVGFRHRTPGRWQLSTLQIFPAGIWSSTRLLASSGLDPIGVRTRRRNRRARRRLFTDVRLRSSAGWRSASDWPTAGLVTATIADPSELETAVFPRPHQPWADRRRTSRESPDRSRVMTT